MRFVDPVVIHVAGTKLDEEGVQHLLSEIGAPDWTTNAASDGQKLIEIGGKLCYKSFHEDLNPNLTRVRTNRNHEYIADGIVKVRHGSVLEHVHETFVFLNVSRVFTHELVRHRLANYSQESLRFVRLTDLGAYFPSVFSNEFLAEIRANLSEGDLVNDQGEPINEADLNNFMRRVFEDLEQHQGTLTRWLGLDRIKKFALKKKLTSAMRRMAPIGLTTNIMMSTNLRQWRHILEMRTSRHAEEEIRKGMEPVFGYLNREHPAVFDDVSVEVVDDILEVTFEHGSI